MSGGPVLIADIGGTNARFALVEPGNPYHDEISLTCADYTGIEEAIDDYLSRIGMTSPPSNGAIAVACPVTGDEIELTNSQWRFSADALRRKFDIPELVILNDFAAIALALPHLTDDDFIQIGDGELADDVTKIVLGPGTGLGAALLVPTENGWIPAATEAGHATLPAYDEYEEKIIGNLRQEFGHVSLERLISGPGLLNLYRTIARMENLNATAKNPGEITAEASNNANPLAKKTLDQFFLFLGTAVADLALSTGARGGVYLAGGILPDSKDLLSVSEFRCRFEDKGRFSSYLNAIPTYLIVQEQPALLGLARMF